MINVRFMGIDSDLLDPRLGPAVLRGREDGTYDAFVNLGHIERPFVGRLAEISELILAQLEPRTAPGEPWGRSIIIREPRTPACTRLVHAEFVEEGIQWRFPESSMSPMLAQYMAEVGTKFHNAADPIWLLNGTPPPKIL